MKIFKAIWVFIKQWLSLIAMPLFNVVLLVLSYFTTITLEGYRIILIAMIVISFIGSFISIKQKNKDEKLKLRTDYSIVKLELLDESNKHIPKYKLNYGQNTFHCRAIYEDGYIDETYSPYWVCFEKGNYLFSNILPNSKQQKVTLSYSENHAKYYELSCWVFPPTKELRNNSNNHSAIEFIYEK